MKAGVDAFAHSVRDKDIDEEGLAMFKQSPEPGRRSEPSGSRRGGGPELAAARCRRLTS